MGTCPDGHVTDASDYCEVCGSPVASTAASKKCPVCNSPLSGRFCETCGHDTALSEPAARPEPTSAVQWTAVITADRDYYKQVIARGGPDTVEFPEFFPERRIVLRDSATLIGRHNHRQGVEPGIDLGIHPVDRGVSTQHAVLRIRDSGLTITDLGSTNGTSLNDGEDLLGTGDEIALTDGDRIHVGAWTTITVTRSGKAPS